jgi:hypothetical protein
MLSRVAVSIWVPRAVMMGAECCWGESGGARRTSALGRLPSAAHCAPSRAAMYGKTCGWA